ncbi:MAG: hypothetical protein A2Y07_10375 [Planctomycetes bacterium GWF2_50_10]|nr:MAG: hypothetical protein A2Y07_10375 [Planctomycetes bacterium GWF2_50_10]
MQAKILLLIALFAFATFSGCGWWDSMRGINKDAIPQGPEPKKITSRPTVSGGIVLPVNGELITIDEVITPLMEDLKPLAEKGDYLDYRRKARPVIEQALDNRVSNIVLYQKAKKEAREGIDEQLDKAADNEIRQFVAGFDGNYAQAEQAIQKMGMNWKTFRDYQKRILLVQGYLHEEFKDKRPITYSDMRNHYEKIKDQQFFSPGAIQFRLIDIQPLKTTPTDPNLSRLESARLLAKDIVAQLNSGGDFGLMAKKYSQEKTRAELGGLWSPVSSGSLAKPYDILETEAAKLQSGQIAGPIEADDHIFIMKLESRREAVYEPFDAVQHKVETSLKFQRRRDAIDALTKKLQTQADIGDQATFVEHCIEKSFNQIEG